MVKLLYGVIYYMRLFMCKTINWFVQNARNIITIGSVILAICAWFFMMSGIPQRVAKLESDVSELKTTMTQQATKTDLILNAVYELRAVALKGK